MTRIVVMTETLPLAAVKTQFSAIVDRVESEHDRVIVTRNGRAAAVLISPDDLESLEETLAVLSDPILMERVSEGRRAAQSGDTISLDELKARLSKS